MSSCHVVNIGALVTASPGGSSVETHHDCELLIENGVVSKIMSRSESK